jgi:inner membrane protein
MVLLAALALPRRTRWLLLGAAAGVLLHLLRDVATGPGVPLLWPLSDASARVPYWTYAVLVLALAGLAGLATYGAGSARAAPWASRS